MIDAGLLSIILGVVVTVATSLGKNPSWSREVKTLFFGGVSALAAVLSLLATGQLAFDASLWADLGTNLSIVMATATAFYNLKFKSTVTNEKLENMGHKAP